MLSAEVAISQEITYAHQPPAPHPPSHRRDDRGPSRHGARTRASGSGQRRAAGARPHATSNTTTPIKHLVVIFQENVSFDHYFGTYPNATNTSGQPFDAAHHTPSVNGLANTEGVGGVGSLLTNNPNKDAGGNQVNPRRLDPANLNDVLTCDQDHAYNDEQKAFDGGAMDKFVTTVGTGAGKSGTGSPAAPTTS